MRTLCAHMHPQWCILAFIGIQTTSLQSVVPGGGVEPPRAEARRILSPLRLPVPPSRLIQLICWRQNHLLDRRRFCEVSVSHSPRTAANRCLAAYSADVGRDNWERL